MSTQSSISLGLAWENYPLENAVYFTPGKDHTFYRQLLSQDPTRIFEHDRMTFEVIRMVCGSNGKS
jgi:hypothetical protein